MPLNRTVDEAVAQIMGGFDELHVQGEVPEGLCPRGFLITCIDVKNAMNVIPGQSVANGHDYRASLAGSRPWPTTCPPTTTPSPG